MTGDPGADYGALFTGLPPRGRAGKALFRHPVAGLYEGGYEVLENGPREIKVRCTMGYLSYRTGPGGVIIHIERRETPAGARDWLRVTGTVNGMDKGVDEAVVLGPGTIARTGCVERFGVGDDGNFWITIEGRKHVVVR